MDRALIEQQLAVAERLVLEAEQNVTRQRERIAQLEGSGFDATMSRDILRQFEQSQAIYIADRERLRRELANLRPPCDGE
jgi:hypothetical protein